MATPNKKPIYRVAVLVFSGADILDFAGPIECLTHASYSRDILAEDPVFSIETVCRSKDAPIPTGAGNLLVQPTMSIAEMLDALDTFHILIVPGGSMDAMKNLSESEGSMEMDLVRKFAEHKSPPKSAGPERVLMSVCTGAMLLASAGVLKGLRATTHHLALGFLQNICDKVSGEGDPTQNKTEVVKSQRFVDAGSKDGLRILTAAGITSGLDASIYLIGIMTDLDSAKRIKEMMEYGNAE